jgi:spermidine synthase
VRRWETIDRAVAPDGTELVLARRGDEWVVRAGGRPLMTSRVHGSEEALASLALARVPRPRTVLLGGLGLGFTLRAVLERLPEEARAIVVELVPAIVAWNRGLVADLARRPLDDPRVRVQVADVHARIAEARGAFDAILLDIDNGPAALVQRENDALYGDAGIRACRDALRAGGILAVWSAGPDERYRERLERAGFAVDEVTVPARGAGAGGTRHVVFLAARAPRTEPRVAKAPAARPRGRAR